MVVLRGSDTTATPTTGGDRGSVREVGVISAREGCVAREKYVNCHVGRRTWVRIA